MKDAEGYSLHLIEYQFEGATWTLGVMARSPQDAEARVAAAGTWGRCCGSDAVLIPARTGFWVPFWVWLRNLLQRG